MLFYIGDGAALVGLPARDVTEKEVKASGYSLAEILESGLYEAADSVLAGKARKEK